MTTALQVCTRAAKTLRYLGRTQTLTAQDANDALVAFNAMLDSWSNESLMSYVVLERSFPLVIGQQAYTIGSGGNINATRPLDITEAYVQDTDGNNFGMWVRPRDWWNAIGNRSTSITSQIPTDIFYDPQYPLGIINVFPTPLIAYTCFFDSTQQQVDLASLNTSISMPEGYELAYVLNLALQMVTAGFPSLLKPEEYAELKMNAATAKANVKRTNIKDVIASYDDALVSRSQATYNIFRDNTNQ